LLNGEKNINNKSIKKKADLRKEYKGRKDKITKGLERKREMNAVNRKIISIRL
jgi:hypothetical protein